MISNSLSVNLKKSIRSNDVANAFYGKLIISISQSPSSVNVWRLKTKKKIKTLIPKDSLITTIPCINFRSRLMGIGSSNCKIKVWNLKTFAEIKILSVHSCAIRSVSLTPDGKTLVSGGWDRTIRFWSMDNFT